MNNNHPNDNNTRGLPFNGFNIGTTIQNVFRNINHAFANGHDSGDISRDPTDEIPPLEPLNSVGRADDTRPADTPPSPAAHDPSIPAGTDADMPPHSQPNSQHDDDSDSMPELRSVTDSSDESDVGIAAFGPILPRQDARPVEDDHDGAWTDDEVNPPLIGPAIGIRRARVDDDGDDARDRRHPSERVGGPPLGDAAPQNANAQQPPRPPPGLFGAVFGLGPPGGIRPGGDALPEHTHTHTGEGTADPLSADNNATPGHAPILTAGFTLTIPLLGTPPGNRPGPAATGQGGPGGIPGAMGMDAATREELFASFAAFFQEFQALEEGREDPERAKKLLAGLEVVPLGLVKRLERVGGAPGGHVGDPNSEGSTSGCAICWDSLLDAESDGYRGLQPSGGEPPQSETRNEAHTGSDAMDIDPSNSHSEPGTSTPGPVTIISLPCAHVFHASCLLPWFTRAKLATCPTCRFNIDPENLTYTPPLRRTFNGVPPVQPENGAPNATQDNPQTAPLMVPQVPSEAGAPAADAAPQVDPVRETTDAHPAATAMPFGPAPAPPPFPPGFNPFFAMPGMPGMPGIPVLTFPAIQIPLWPNAAPAPGDGNQGMDVLTIGLDMFLGVPPPPGERGGDHRDNAEGGNGTDNSEAGTGPAGGNGPANPNGLAQDLHTLIEGLLRTTRNIIPQVINAQGPGFPLAPDAPPADGARPQPQSQPQTGPTPEGAGRQFVPPPMMMGGPRAFPFVPFRPNMFRPTRPMPPRRKTWTLPPAPGPSLRQRVEQREREQGLRCSDTSCGVGPSDDDPYPEAPASSTGQMYIHPLPNPNYPEHDGRAPVCAHAFHPECLVSAERVAGWGGEDKTKPLVEVSCPVCRAVGYVTREEWESGVSAL